MNIDKRLLVNMGKFGALVAASGAVGDMALYMMDNDQYWVPYAAAPVYLYLLFGRSLSPRNALENCAELYDDAFIRLPRQIKKVMGRGQAR